MAGRWGGGGDGRAVDMSDWAVVLRWRRSSMVEARWRRCCGAASLWRGARAREKTRARVSVWVSGEPRALPFCMVGWASIGGLLPHGLSILGTVGHDGRRFESARVNSVRLTVDFQTSKSPKPWWISENFINTKCRATWVLQDCLKEFCLNRNGFQTIRLQNRLHWNWKKLQDLEKFSKLQTALSWKLWALFDHVRHWFSSWPLNKVCYPWCELQLLFRSHSHANNISYCSTLVKLASWKWHYKVAQHRSKIDSCHEYKSCSIYHPRCIYGIVVTLQPFHTLVVHDYKHKHIYNQHFMR